jgi:hypothetical protein
MPASFSPYARHHRAERGPHPTLDTVRHDDLPQGFAPSFSSTITALVFFGSNWSDFL